VTVRWILQLHQVHLTYNQKDRYNGQLDEGSEVAKTLTGDGSKLQLGGGLLCCKNDTQGGLGEAAN